MSDENTNHDKLSKLKYKIHKNYNESFEITIERQFIEFEKREKKGLQILKGNLVAGQSISDKNSAFYEYYKLKEKLNKVKLYSGCLFLSMSLFLILNKKKLKLNVSYTLIYPLFITFFVTGLTNIYLKDEFKKKLKKIAEQELKS